ncbi:hypothetical protein MC7420_552 [Coleofasciculus chthonoplastes PCC 7420]|uniref:Uncharacterized protein n=1 Tax=Coleofasciculus chthonoplastes PCC 7420 TaxID=118168 RepID=B4VLF0_9CYAN|nr:hypothetical protein MC7420_552 [Coleofasciculus chthonoplastes PCC 7420]
MGEGLGALSGIVHRAWGEKQDEKSVRLSGWTFQTRADVQRKG